MEKHVLTKLLDEGLTQRQLASRLGKSQTTARYWIAKFGLHVKAKCRNFCCRFCGELDKEKFALRHGKPCRTICKPCDSKRAVERARKNKLLAIAYKGCKCSICGYCKHPAALCFHHVDPSRKDPNFDKMKFWSFDRIKSELDKCVLVCANCHIEAHHPLA